MPQSNRWHLHTKRQRSETSWEFTYIGSSVSSTETDIDTRLAKAWTTIDRLSVVWKSDLTDKMKHSFFQLALVSILLYEYTTWTLTKSMEKKLDGKYKWMQWAILNKSWRQHPTKRQLYGHSPPITKTIKIRRSRHARHSWRSRDELVSDVLLWIPSQGWAKEGRPARTYTQQLCVDTGYSPEDLPKAMDDREGGERGPEISVLRAWHDDDGDDDACIKLEIQHTHTHTHTIMIHEIFVSMLTLSCHFVFVQQFQFIMF